MYNMRKTKVKRGRKSRRRVYTKKMRGGYRCNGGYKNGYTQDAFHKEMDRLNWNRPTGKDEYATKACVTGKWLN